MKREFNVIIERDVDGFYIAAVPELKGAIHRLNLKMFS
jgi:predicted RNase H-like HicB family nuclease